MTPRRLASVLAFAAGSVFAIPAMSQQSQQVPEWRNVLSLPVGPPIVCTLAGTAITNGMPPAAIFRTFRIGQPYMTFETTWPREITVVFDSTGQARLLVDEAHFITGKGMPAGEQAAFGLFAKDSAAGYRIDITVDTVALAQAADEMDVDKGLSAAKPPVKRELSVDEVAKLRTLTAFLWKHLCFRDGKT